MTASRLSEEDWQGHIDLEYQNGFPWMRRAGCRCEKPLLGWRPAIGARCRTCNVVARMFARREDLSSLRMTIGMENHIEVVIDGNQVMRWVGIGWLAEGDATESHYSHFPVVID